MDSMMSTDCSPLSGACIKALTDRLEGKRKYAATQIEKMALEFSINNNKAMIEKLVDVLGNNFCLSHIPNSRKGGLIGLAAIMVGYKNGTSQKPSRELIEKIVRPILTCFQDPDARVRYYACEALYNIVKVAKSNISHLLLDIFDNLAKVISDVDISVRNGAEIIDKLLRDIICEDNSIAEIKPLVSCLRDYLYTKNSFTRMFVISWIRFLDSIKSDMINHLPNILDGLFHCLYDATEEVRASLLPTMSEFLDKLVSPQTKVEPATLMKVVEVTAKELQVSENPTVKLTILEWFIKMRHSSDILFTDYNLQQKLFSTLLDCLSDSSDAVVKSSLTVLAELLCFEQQQDPEPETTNTAVDQSIKFTKEEDAETLNRRSPGVRPNLASTNLKTSKKVAISAGDVVNIYPQTSSNLDKFMHSLYRLFRERETVFNDRASFIILNLCELMKSETIYKCFALQLADENQDPRFACRLVLKLNEILFTAKSLHGLRTRLRTANDDNSQETTALFQILYQAWCHAPIATLSICFLTNNYRLACEVVSFLPQLDMTIEILLEIDKLVQLIESPIFVPMRMKLLEQDNYHILKSLYGILMLLPQSGAYTKLRSRLDCIHNFVTSSQHQKSISHTTSGQSKTVIQPQTSQSTIPTSSKETTKKSSSSSTQEMLKYFQNVQTRHLQLQDIDAY